MVNTGGSCSLPPLNPACDSWRQRCNLHLMSRSRAHRGRSRLLPCGNGCVQYLFVFYCVPLRSGIIPLAPASLRRRQHGIPYCVRRGVGRGRGAEKGRGESKNSNGRRLAENRLVDRAELQNSLNVQTLGLNCRIIVKACLASSDGVSCRSPKEVPRRESTAGVPSGVTGALWPCFPCFDL